MADISVIKVNNADYTIKDTTARNHIASTSNPHSVTKSQVGLGNVENKSSATIRGELTSANVTSALGYTPVNPNVLGANNGVATLGSDGKVPASQLPSYVDDVIEGYFHDDEFFTTRTGDGTSASPYTYTGEITGETGKIYVDKNTNKTYRWGGTAYAEISSSLALGETSSTAYRGDRGATAYSHATETKSGAKTSGFYKIAVTSQGHVGSTTAVTKADITGLGIPGSNTTYAAGTGITITGTTNAINQADTLDSEEVAAGMTPTGITSGNDVGKVNLPSVTVNKQGHATAISSKKLKIALNATTDHDVLSSHCDYAPVTPEGSVSQPTFTGTAATIASSASYKPAGSVSAPTVSLTVSKTGSSDNGDCLVEDTATAGTLPTLSMSVTNETLTITLNQGNFPVYKTQRCVKDVSVASVSAPTFTGTQATINSSGSYTPAGTVSKPTFSGTGKFVVADLQIES
ncbi:MAG: hypothetical protein J5800_06290 [Spirochaetales bacterium]|nr:hypothetical protein [Spirochaetales bacterium]